MITTEALCVSYQGRAAIRNVSLTIPKGEVTAVVGPSGCGKSTFLSALNRMTDLTPGCEVRGSVRLCGEELYGARVDLIALRRRVGMIFQRPNPFPLSILENLTFPLEHHGATRAAARDEAERALRRVGLWEEVKDRLQSAALRLSGGQQQRLCLARALALRPEVLLLDEPCSALDPLASDVVEALIASLRGEYTVVIVTHNLAQARRLADQLAVFWVEEGAGALIEAGPAASLLRSPQRALTARYFQGAQG
jgi:phosphate transport system ATP-binding protein